MHESRLTLRQCLLIEKAMRKEKLNSILNAAEELGSATVKLTTYLTDFTDATGQPFRLGTQIPQRDSSVSEVISRIQSVLGIVAEYKRSTRLELTPNSVLDQLQNSIEGTNGAIDTLQKGLEAAKVANGGLANFELSNFHAKGKNNQSTDLRPHFHGLYDNTESLLSAFFVASNILKPRGSYSYQAAATSLKKIIESAQSKLDALKTAVSKSAAAETELEAKLEHSNSSAAEIKRLQEEVASDRAKTADYLALATQHKTEIEAVKTAAATLQADVDSYQGSFDSFQRQLDDRETEIESGTAKLDQLVGKLETQENRVKELIEQSEQMLASATVSGLASNFSNIAETLTTELGSARRSFYLGLALLAVSALPLAAFVILPLAVPFLISDWPGLAEVAKQYSPASSYTGWQYLGQVLARFIILLPAAWLVSFSAIRHSQLFKLREHYTYKNSMAAAVPGFKLQAPDYEQEIAALVLEELAFNPADKLAPSKDIKEGKIPGPISNFLFDRLKKRIDKSTSSE